MVLVLFLNGCEISWTLVLVDHGNCIICVYHCVVWSPWLKIWKLLDTLNDSSKNDFVPYQNVAIN